MNVSAAAPHHNTWPVSLKAIFFVFGKIGLLSFGGPAAQIALMHRLLVDEKKWLSEQQYLSALSFCMLLPGPEAMQLATYMGWRLRGTLGGLIGGLLFVLPGALVILALASCYAFFGNIAFVSALFLGIKATVFIIVIQALIKVARKALKHTSHWLIAGLAFICLFFLSLPFPLIILIAGLYGFFATSKTAAENTAVIKNSQSLTKALQNIVIWACLWISPTLIAHLFLEQNILVDIGAFFAKLAVVTFGGAYAVLAYMAQDVVVEFGWLSATEMIDGLGLAETTPGPLILVTEFVGFIAGFKAGGFWLGLTAAALTLWVTFVPCFLWIFVGAPYIEWITAQPRLSGALSAITAAVVGVMLNLSIWFGLHVLFVEVTQTQVGILTLWQPTLSTLDWQVIIISILSGLALLKLKWGILPTLTAAAALSWGLSFI